MEELSGNETLEEIMLHLNANKKRYEFLKTVRLIVEENSLAYDAERQCALTERIKNLESEIRKQADLVAQKQKVLEAKSLRKKQYKYPED